jgi:hypothetical protein
MGRLKKFWRLAKGEKLLLFESTCLLVLASLSVRLVAFKHIDRFLRNYHARAAGKNWISHPDQAHLLDLSLSRAARLLPWKSLCLSRSIAGFIMLRRRGIAAVMFAGVKVFKDSSLYAHAWVDTGSEVTDSTLEAREFTTLLRIGERDNLFDRDAEH